MNQPEKKKKLWCEKDLKLFKQTTNKYERYDVSQI